MHLCGTHPDPCHCPRSFRWERDDRIGVTGTRAAIPWHRAQSRVLGIGTQPSGTGCAYVYGPLDSETEQALQIGVGFQEEGYSIQVGSEGEHANILTGEVTPPTCALLRLRQEILRRSGKK